MTVPLRFTVVDVPTMLVLATGTVFGSASGEISTATGGRPIHDRDTEPPHDGEGQDNETKQQDGDEPKMRLDKQITNVSRRTVLKYAVGAGAVAGLSSLALGQQQQPIKLGGRMSGWIGRAPERIDGVVNPTLRLVAGQTYTLVWENLDGIPHQFVIEDAAGNALITSETTTEQGATATVTFEATTEMTEYYCSVHPTSMRGAIQVSTATEMPTQTPTETATPTETPAATPTPTASVVFEDQTSNGMTVGVESVTMSDGGFVAIHETANGGVGPVIGVSKFLDTGTHQNVTVMLFELPGAEFDQSALSESQTLIAMPHLDTNGNQVYEFVSSNGSEDGPYVANGGAVVDSASITVEEADKPAAPTASVVFNDQTSDGTTVVVESVTMSDGGFVAIHETANGGVGPVIGVSQFVDTGTHTDVSVTLFELPGADFTQSALTESQTLIAMPHLDTNGNQVYEFVSSNGNEDGPYVANGGAVVDSASITVEDEATVCEAGSTDEVVGENDEDDDGDGAIDEDDEDGDGPSNDDDDGDGAVDEDDECDDGDDGMKSIAEDDDDGDGAVDEDDEPDSGNSDDVDNDGDGAVDEDDESDTDD